MRKHKYTLLYGTIVEAIFVFAALLLSSSYANADIAAVDKGAAVVFAYQHIGEESAVEGGISAEQFREHITELTKGGYAVLPLQDIVDVIKKGAALPPKTVAITFDGAYQATLAYAMPVLNKAEMPFTVFFAADMVDSPGYMSWSQLKKLKKNKRVSLGLLPASYAHMLDKTPEERSSIINRAISKYREVLNEEPAFFAYPYGEYDSALKKQLATYNFKAVFGQHSGVVHPQSDFLALPRFMMTDDYGDLDRFILTAHALPLPVSDVVPQDNVVLEENPPHIGFTVTQEIPSISRLSCFASGFGKLELAKIAGNRVEIRPKQPFVERRTRINCTIPSATITPGEPRSWRWYGMMFVSPSQGEGAEMNSTENQKDPEDQ